MGIKHFFGWFRKNFSNRIINMLRNETVNQVGVEVDNFLLDMNSIFHNCAQKVYQYGAYKPLPSLLGKKLKVPENNLENQMKCFREICNVLEHIVNVVKPKKRLILCVDGPAPISKQRQQRARRFVSAKLSSEEKRTFDSNCITPGTKFMDYLTKYIDWFIRKKISEDSNWKNLEVIFSNEKAAGEGEQKLINYIRKFGDSNEVFCINGMDADLIMLALGTHLPKFYILRDETILHDISYYLIDVSGVADDLANTMEWPEEKCVYSPKSAIDDFILMCFTVGNDFLPNIPGLEISEGGIDLMLETYRNIGMKHGHLTETDEKKGVVFRRKTLSLFLQDIAEKEETVFADKAAHSGIYFPDSILQENTEYKDGEWFVDVENYRKQFYLKKFPSNNITETFIRSLCHDYLEGMQWVLSYYTKGVPNWLWQYKYHYAPFAYDLCKNVETFTFVEYPRTSPSIPFIQLMCTMPPASRDLLPYPLSDLIDSHISEIKEFYPEEFEVDISGKKQEWEGTVILPTVNYSKIEKTYKKYQENISAIDQKRNRLGKTFVYSYSEEADTFLSYYGNFTCNVRMGVIEI